jgi:cellulose synthase/poly-beta-1,6-N-acetylglucosamine synthase-like glycosyltransferase
MTQDAHQAASAEGLLHTGSSEDPDTSAPTGVRVIIPAFKASRTIRSCATAVLNSSVNVKLDIVVVDDGGHDDLAGMLAGLPVTLAATGGSGSAAVARNRGAEGFIDGYLVFVDADVLVDPFCLERLLAPLIAGNAEATVGNYSSEVGELNFAGRYKQLYTSRIYNRRRGYLRNEFWTAIGAIGANIFHDLGGFDASFPGAIGEDTELGCRLSQHRYRILSVPDARGRHLRPQTLRQIILNDWRKGRATMQILYLSGRPLSDFRHATRRDTTAVLLVLPAACLTPILLVAGAPPPIAAAVGAACAIAYLGTRADVIGSFLSQGGLFATRAIAMMILLDYVRLACAGTSFWFVATKWFPRRLRRRNLALRGL